MGLEKLRRDLLPKLDFLNRELIILNASDLTDEQSRLTSESYDKNSTVYQSMYELSLDMNDRTEEDYLGKFRAITQELSQQPHTLVLGSGNGRDCLKLALDGVKIHAVDYSSEMMKKLAWHFINPSSENNNLEKFKYTISNILDLAGDFAFEDFHSILADSCFQHINHPSVFDFLKKALPWLKPGGAILFRLKLTEHGNAYVIHDGVGTRYYTSWTLEEIAELKQFLLDVGYQLTNEPVEQLQITPHKDSSLGTPSFISIVARKPSSPTS